MKRATAMAGATTELFVSLFIILSLALGIYLVINDKISIGRMLIGLDLHFWIIRAGNSYFSPARVI